MGGADFSVFTSAFPMVDGLCVFFFLIRWVLFVVFTILHTLISFGSPM